MKEREFKSCASEKLITLLVLLLLIKKLFEEVPFKTSFEGREGMAVMESERKRIAGVGSRKAKGMTTK